ncbi:YceD family protein [Rubrivirga sp. IMCC43871]|uniref:YceD family protein n=1 Tax=Rubrivirga sp. IMCC43871 TaxID=3391575 RepID=UPI00398FD0AC
MFRVSIASLTDGLHQETAHPTADDLGLDPDVFSDVEVALTLDLSERRVLAAYTARATARLECDRTLDLYDQPVEGSHAVVFTVDAISADDDETLPLEADAQEVDLTQSVHDTLLLAVPLRHVSPAAAEAELPTAFGSPSKDEPADDRWAALQALRPDGGDDS